MSILEKKMGEGGQKVQTSSYKLNKPCDVMYSVVNYS